MRLLLALCLLFSFSACALIDEKDTDSKQQNVIYLDESKEIGNQLKLVKIINNSSRYLNERNREDFLSLWAGNKKTYDYYTEDLQMKILALSKPEFDPSVENSDSTSVKVTRLTETQMGKEEREAVYVFIKKDDDWKIALIEN